MRVTNQSSKSRVAAVAPTNVTLNINLRRRSQAVFRPSAAANTYRIPRAVCRQYLAKMDTPAPQPHRLTLRVPSSLPVPTPRPVDASILAELDPALSAVPPAFISQKLASMSASFLAGIQSCAIQPPASANVKEATVHFMDHISIPVVAPTHILALRSNAKSSSSKTKVSFYLIHQIQFASSCSNFTRLPKSDTATMDGNRTHSATLPVVHATIPSPDDFLLLQNYLYTRDTASLRATFLPSGWNESKASVLKQMGKIKGFWSNAVALAMQDTAMYNVIQDCYSRVLRTLDALVTAENGNVTLLTFSMEVSSVVTVNNPALSPSSSPSPSPSPVSSPSTSPRPTTEVVSSSS